MEQRLFWLAVGAFATSTMAFVFAGLLPLVSAATGVTISEAGHLATIYALAYAVGTPVLATLAGSFDRRRVIVAALVVFLVGVACAGVSRSYLGLALAQVVTGAAAGLFAATAQATAVTLAGVEHRARAVSVVVGGTTFAVALGAPIGALLGTLFGWRATFAFVGLLAAACAVILAARLPRGLAGVRLGLGERLLVVARPGVLPALATTLLYLTGSFIIISYMAPIAVEAAGLSPAAIPLMLLAFGVGAVAGNFGSGRLTDRVGAARVVTASLATSIASALLIFATVSLLPAAAAGPLVIAIMVPWGIGGWAFTPAQASRLVALAPELASLTLPLNISAIYFGIALGSLLGGRLLDAAPAANLPLAGIPFFLASLAVLAATERPSRARAGCPRAS
jgi:DHA1 family inner membrane transport protein